jgi:hypothetical protein
MSHWHLAPLPLNTTTLATMIPAHKSLGKENHIQITAPTYNDSEQVLEYFWENSTSLSDLTLC